jgi:uncharacterized protein YeaO (DUF488 family)
MNNMINLKRVYEPATRSDGFRILVERLWPRGLSKQAASVDLWLKEIAPSTNLRIWYGHDIDKWKEFQRRYRNELRGNQTVQQLRDLLVKKKIVTFVYGARDEEHNSARVLKEYLEKHT